MTASPLPPGAACVRLAHALAGVLVTAMLALACLGATAAAATPADPAAGGDGPVEAAPTASAMADMPMSADASVTRPEPERSAARDMRSRGAARAARAVAPAARRRTGTTRLRRRGTATAAASSSGRCAPARGVLISRRSVLLTKRRLLCLVNRARARFGLPRLRANRCLDRVARRHAGDMVRRRYFGHVTPNGWDVGRRAVKSGYVPRSRGWRVGENLAWGVARAARPSRVLRAWMHSPGHRRNLLNRRFRDIGIGVVRGTPRRGFQRWRLRATFSVELGAGGGRAHCRHAHRR